MQKPRSRRRRRAALEVRLQELIRANAEQAGQISILREDARPRTFSQQQRSIVIESIRTFLKAPNAPANREVTVQIYAAENEPAAFASIVERMLSDGGLAPNTVTVMGGAGVGFGVLVHAQDDVPPLAMGILTAFQAAGIPLALVIEPSRPEHTFIIAIGVKARLSN